MTWRRPPVADRAENSADGDGCALGYPDFAQHARYGSGHLNGDLVGLELDQRLVDFDLVAGLLEPLADDRFRDAFAQSRHANFRRHLDLVCP